MRTWMKVYEDGEKNTFVITWEPGDGLDWHDHSGSHVTILVSDGELFEQIREDHDRDTVYDEYLTPGNLYVRPRNVEHRIVNLGNVGAVSIHTYMPPISDEVPGVEIG